MISVKNDEMFVNKASNYVTMDLIYVPRNLWYTVTCLQCTLLPLLVQAVYTSMQNSDATGRRFLANLGKTRLHAARYRLRRIFIPSAEVVCLASCRPVILVSFAANASRGCFENVGSAR